MLLTLALLIPSVVLADEPEDLSTPQFTFVDFQQPAPFRGTLFNPRATAELLSMPRALQAECDLEMEYQLDIQSTDYQFRLATADTRYNALSENISLWLHKKT